MAVMANPARTIVCSVLFLDIVEYSKNSVAEQLVLKQSFNRVLSKALEAIAATERVVLDTGDGAAIAFLGDPEDALFIALTIRENTTLPVRMGVNLGPVRLVKDINGQANIIGDGINVAQRVMSFSDPGQLLVSRSFYEVASRLSNDYANLFAHAGSRSDKHVREHEVYSVITDFGASRGGTETETIKGRDDWRKVELSAGPIEPAARGETRPAQIFDAGEHLIVSGYSKSSVDEALKTLAQAGSRVISAATRVSEKWIASCEHPQACTRTCKVATIEGKQIVTGPTREAVSAKVEELVHFGATLVSDVTLTHGAWTAVCQIGER
jgi:class 3 adenylate cyclase